MPSISDFNLGYDANGVANYLEEIKGGLLKNAAEAVKDVSKINESCNNNWEGKSKEKFLKDLEKDAEHVAEQFEELYYILEGEISSLQSAMQENDRKMFD